jgi:hypothetical protein
VTAAPASGGPPVKVLSVTGWCRNGSTILGNVLGEVPGFCHVGELHFLWLNSAGQGANNRCGCGAALTSCPVWSELLPTGRPADLPARPWAQSVVRRQRAWLRTRHTWRVLRGGPQRPQLRAHAELLAQTYQAIAGRLSAQVIVDTSKMTAEAALLPHLAGVDPYFVHLVRDPRAVAQSWSRQKDYAYIMPAWKSTAYWDGFNLAAAAVARRYPERSVLLRYEDFIADPQATIDRLLRFCGADPAANPVRGRTVDLHTNHTVTGNPDRFLTGPTEIRPADDSWRTGLPRAGQLTVAALAGPLMWRYGYGVGGLTAGGQSTGRGRPWTSDSTARSR